MAPNMVNTFQCPCGVASAIRCPRAALPHRRVICVVTPLSSRKISRSGGTARIVSMNSWRRCWFAAVSRSCAWRDFFAPQSHLPQHLPDPALADADAAGLQALAQLRLGQVRLLLEPAPQMFLRRFRHAADGTVMRLRNPLLLPGALLLPPDLFAILQAHSEPVRQLPQTAGTRLIRFQKLAA